MLREAAAWLLHSPRRLLAAAVPVVVLAVLGTVAFNADDPAPSGAQSSTATPSRAPAVRPAQERHEAHTEPTAPAALIRRAAVRFVDAYVVPPTGATPSVIPRSLRNSSTPALWRGLRLARPDTLPHGTVGRTSVDTAGPFAGTVTVELDRGSALVLSVVAWDRGWRVSDIRSAEGP